MIDTSSSYFPFNGTCKCSRDGDTMMTFDDGTALRTHSVILKMASAVFNSLLTDSMDAKELKIENTSPQTWVHILNHMHPATRT